MRIVVAEDSVLLREGIVRLLQEIGHEVVSQVGSAPELEIACSEHLPDLAIVDVRMPPTHSDDGLRAALRVRQQHPQIAMLVLSQYIEANYARRLLADARGGVGYLLKDRVSDIDAFADAIGQVGGGGVVIDPQVIAQLVVRGRPATGVGALTQREREVLELVAQGRSNVGIAQQLFLSVGAVEKNISQIFMKLNLGEEKSDHRRVLAVLEWLNHDPGIQNPTQPRC